jgi:hypothetical protein
MGYKEKPVYALKETRICYDRYGWKSELPETFGESLRHQKSKAVPVPN